MYLIGIYYVLRNRLHNELKQLSKYLFIQSVLIFNIYFVLGIVLGSQHTMVSQT